VLLILVVVVAVVLLLLCPDTAEYVDTLVNRCGHRCWTALRARLLLPWQAHH
jgi:hypothetical protein